MNHCHRFTNFVIGLGLVLLSCFIGACSENDPINARQFRSCAELSGFIQSVNERQKKQGGPVLLGASANAEDSGKGGEGDSLQLQEAGVDEADKYRMTKEAIYVSRGNQIEVISRASLKMITTLKVNGRSALYYDEGFLLAVVRRAKSFEVQQFDLNSGGVPLLKASQSFEGSLTDSRMHNGHLYLIYSNYVSTVNAEQEKVSGVKCDCINRPFENENDLRLTAVTSLKTKDISQEPDTLAVLGGGDVIYMSPQHLYLTATEYLAPKIGGFLPEGSPYSSTAILQINLEGALKLSGKGQVGGYIKDRWALKELNQNVLSIVTSVNGQKNYLTNLETSAAKFETLGQTEAFGLNEDVRAVRFYKDRAYVVTFKKTDPLFAIDLKDSSAPRLVSELEMPGFSTQLYPVEKGILVGVGFDAKDMGNFAWFQGIKISVFGEDSQGNLKESDKMIMGTRGSISDATSDTHSFYWNSTNRLIGIPVSLLEGETTQPWQTGTEAGFSGALMYQLTTENKLKEAARLSHRPWVEKTCQLQLKQGAWWADHSQSLDINRLYPDGEQLLALSRFGISSHSVSDLQTKTQELKFEDLEATELCTDYDLKFQQ